MKVINRFVDKMVVKRCGIVKGREGRMAGQVTN